MRGRVRPPSHKVEVDMKVTCIKDVTFSAIKQSFVAGEKYDIPAEYANKSEYFKKDATKTTKKATTEENK